MIARTVPGLALATLAALMAIVGEARQLPDPAQTVTAGTPPPPGARSPRNASYAIAARLDPESHTIAGEERIAWRNVASVPASTLQFHLYYNAWRNTRSSWMGERMTGSGPPAASRPDDDWGWIDVTGIRLGDSGSDLTATARFIAPDDGNPEDRTVLEVPLDTPVPPGGGLDVLVTWTARVPRTFARTGRIGSFYFIAQWFPKLGVFGDTGWNTHQFHAATEFFADFGTYDVRLSVPAGWVVGATGTERERRDEGNGTTTHRYYQEDVHDFAWTTSPDLIERRERFEHPTLPAVDMRLLLQPEHAGQADRHFAATRAALQYYGEWFGPYPYGHVTVVDPAWQSGAGGMEYPTLFTAGTRWLAPPDVAQPESVTVHEAGHQFWYGIVASNEFEHAWMDEGLNTFSTARTLAAAFPPTYYAERFFGGFIPWVYRDLPLSRATDGNRLSGYRAVATHDVPATPTWQYWPGSASAITYNKTALWLHTLERMLGWETLQRVLSTYFARWSFRHPEPGDFFAVVNEVTGRDYTWFFDQVYRSSHAFDYAVDQLRSEPDTGRGYFGEGAGRALASAHGDAGQFRTTVVVRRRQDGVFPVTVRLTLENGAHVDWQWDGRDRWKRFETSASARASHVQIDPDRILLLDLDYTNNSATRSPQGRQAARKWSLAWLIWLQDQLLTYGFFV